MKTRNLLKTLCVALLVGVITASSLVGCFKPEEKEESAIKVENVTSNGMSISFFSETVVETGEEVYIEKAVIGVITPPDAHNTGMTWLLKWENEEETANIDEYAKIISATPYDDYRGQERCLFRVYKPFAGKNIILTVKSDEGGHEASCTLVYLGIPFTMEVSNLDGINRERDDYLDEYLSASMYGSYPLVQGQTYNFEMKLKQVFDCIAYTPEYQISVKLEGGINLAQDSISEPTRSVVLQEKTPGIISVENSSFNLFKYVVTGNTLNIEILNLCEDIRGVDFGSTIEEKGFLFHSFKDGKMPVFKITVKETKTGFSKDIRFRIFKGVQGVSTRPSKVEI